MSNSSPSSPRPINVAVVGLGFMGVTHLRAYQQNPSARIVAVCDAVRLPVNGVLQGVAGNVKKTDDIHLGTQVRVYRQLEDTLKDPEVELVDLCTPTPLHPEQCIAALTAGKNVLCEKPLARTSAAGKEVLRAAAKAKGFLMPAMCMRFWPGWSWLKSVVQDQTYGQVVAARFRRMSEMPGWSKQGTYGSPGNDLGGALFDLHIHDTDFVNFLFGRPASVFSSGVDSAGSINHVVTHYNYPGGPVVYAEGSWLLTQGFNMAYTLHCERATVDYDLSRGAGALVVSERGKGPEVRPCEGPDGYSQETAYVLECLQKASVPAIVTGADAVTALEICEAEEKSVRTRQVVPL